MKIIKLVCVLIVVLSIIDNSHVVEAKPQKGNVRYTRGLPRKHTVYKHPKWMDDICEVFDAIFDWFGYHEIPHTMRYSICLFILLAPVWAIFFWYCCVHNGEYDDPEEEMQFKQRYQLHKQRTEARLKKAREMKWD